MADNAKLRAAFQAAIDTDRALAGDAGDFDARVERDHRARRQLLDLLRDIAGPVDQDAAVVGPDGTIAVRSIEADGLALVPPDRTAWLPESAEVLHCVMRSSSRTRALPLVVITRLPDGGLGVEAADPATPAWELADLCWAASVLITDQIRSGPSRPDVDRRGGGDPS